MINVLGDALAAGIIGHLCQKNFPLGDAGKVQRFVVKWKHLGLGLGLTPSVFP